LEKLKITWNLQGNTSERIVKRYCHNCGKATIFRDSMARRVNANGKRLYQYAIYKCEKDHTWNQKLSVYQADAENMDHNEETDINAPSETVSLHALRQKNILAIEIYLNRIEGKWRLDKLLSQRLIGISRSEIVKWIQQGVILVDGVQVKPGQSIQQGQSIWIDFHCQYFWGGNIIGDNAYKLKFTKSD
jgi:hypothetical protein